MKVAQAIIKGKVLGEVKGQVFVNKETGEAIQPKRKISVYQDGYEHPVVVVVPNDYKLIKDENVSLNVEVSTYLLNGKSGVIFKLV